MSPLQNATNGWHQLWFDDEVTLTPKYALAANASLHGVGIWTANYLPYDDPWLSARVGPMWGSLRSYFYTGSMTSVPTQTASVSNSPRTPSPLPTSTNGQCGFVMGRCTAGLCCSAYGFCGSGQVSH